MAGSINAAGQGYAIRARQQWGAGWPCDKWNRDVRSKMEASRWQAGICVLLDGKSRTVQ